MATGRSEAQVIQPLRTTQLAALLSRKTINKRICGICPCSLLGHREPENKCLAPIALSNSAQKQLVEFKQPARYRDRPCPAACWET